MSILSDLRYSVWFSLKSLPGARVPCRLMEAFGSAEAIYQADEKALLQVEGVTQAFADKLADKSMDEALRIIDFCNRRHITILPCESPDFPKRLRRLPDFPLLLYIRGRLPDIDRQVCIAAVGTRRVTEYGGMNAYLICRDMARAGAIVVSGMANGIDTCCHRGALDALGTTLAVLGSGVDVIYPKNNADLAEEIARTGALISEFAPGTPPAAYNFPKRNRIISGLCLGTLVVEADRKSGAMITARTAQMQGRDIFALPGNVGEMNSLGTNDLIKEGARMVTDAVDILSEYELLFPEVLHPERLLVPLPTVDLAYQHGIFRVASPRSVIVDDRPESKKPPLKMWPSDKTEDKGEKEKKDGKKKAQDAQKRTDGKDAEKGNARTGRKSKSEAPQAAPQAPEAPSVPLSDIEQQVLDAMPTDRSITSDEIARAGIPIAKALVALTMLEVKHLIVSLPGGAYMKNL